MTSIPPLELDDNDGDGGALAGVHVERVGVGVTLIPLLELDDNGGGGVGP